MHTIDVHKQVYAFRMTCLARCPALIHSFKLTRRDSLVVSPVIDPNVDPNAGELW
jgi:hypothetical protein